MFLLYLTKFIKPTSKYPFFLVSDSLLKSIPITFSRFLKEPIYPPLNEDEIREIFAKGSGPGGQKLNKATNRCQLKHLPTGI